MLRASSLFLLASLFDLAAVAQQTATSPPPTTTSPPVTELAFAPGVDPSTKIDPAADGWVSETSSARADAQLERVAGWIRAGAVSSTELAEVIVPGLGGESVHPPSLEALRRSGSITVRGAASVGSLDSAESSAESFGDGVRALALRLEGLVERRVDFKIFRIEIDAEGFRTAAYFEAFGRSQEGSRQINAVWTCRWTLPIDPTTAPRLERVEVTEYKEADAEVEGGLMFEDVTASALSHNPSYRSHLMQQPEQWLSRITKGQGFNKTGWQGVSVADVDGDGLEDVFLPDQGGLPNRLFRQNPDGTFDDWSARSAVDFLDKTLAGLFVDLDNDGDPDLVLASRPAVLVLENDGTGGFHELRFVGGAIPDSHSLSAADYDLDGDLDLYVCAYRRAPDERGIASPIPYHDANNGGRNVLLENQGEFQFRDVTREVGLDQNNRRFSLAAAWEDFDNDGDPDLYVANDYGRNSLYRNQRVESGGVGRAGFEDVASELGVEDISSGMSVSWADFDRDGRMDLYVGNMFSAAGNRIAYQRKFERERQRAGPLERVQRMARGNSLFQNRAGGFVDRSEVAAVTMGRWAWSSVFADLDNDGWQDLVIANGNLTQSNPDDL